MKKVKSTNTNDGETRKEMGEKRSWGKKLKLPDNKQVKEARHKKLDKKNVLIYRGLFV